MVYPIFRQTIVQQSLLGLGRCFIHSIQAPFGTSHWRCCSALQPRSHPPKASVVCTGVTRWSAGSMFKLELDPFDSGVANIRFHQVVVFPRFIHGDESKPLQNQWFSWIGVIIHATDIHQVVSHEPQTWKLLFFENWQNVSSWLTENCEQCTCSLMTFTPLGYSFPTPSALSQHGVTV